MSLNTKINKNKNLNHNSSTQVTNIPYRELSKVGNDAGMFGNVLVNKEDGLFYYHNGTEWLAPGEGNNTIGSANTDPGTVNFAITVPSPIFTPGDTIFGGVVDTGSFVIGSENPAIGPNEWPPGEGPIHAIDGVGQKFLINTPSFPGGVFVIPSVGPSIVTRITVWTANDSPNRDPTEYFIYGTNDSDPSTATLTLISNNPINLPASRNAGGNAPLDPANSASVYFTNTTQYNSYVVVFNQGFTNLLQFAEVQLYGDIISQPEETGISSMIGTNGILLTETSTAINIFSYVKLVENVAFVDTTHGNDATAILGNPTSPYQTIQAGIDAVSPLYTPGSNFVNVHVNKGTYVEDIDMPDGVSVFFEEDTYLDGVVISTAQTTSWRILGSCTFTKNTASSVSLTFPVQDAFIECREITGLSIQSSSETEPINLTVVADRMIITDTQDPVIFGDIYFNVTIIAKEYIQCVDRFITVSPSTATTSTSTIHVEAPKIMITNTSVSPTPVYGLLFEHANVNASIVGNIEFISATDTCGAIGILHQNTPLATTKVQIYGNIYSDKTALRLGDPSENEIARNGKFMINGNITGPENSDHPLIVAGLPVIANNGAAFDIIVNKGYIQGGGGDTIPDLGLVNIRSGFNLWLNNCIVNNKRAAGSPDQDSCIVVDNPVSPLTTKIYAYETKFVSSVGGNSVRILLGSTLDTLAATNSVSYTTTGGGGSITNSLWDPITIIAAPDPLIVPTLVNI